MLIASLFAIKQLETLSVSAFMVLGNISIFLPAKNTLISSAKRMNLERSEDFAMSFM